MMMPESIVWKVIAKEVLAGKHRKSDDSTRKSTIVGLSGMTWDDDCVKALKILNDTR